MSNILINTHIFVRLEGDHKYLLECIKKCYDIIIFSNEILKEYKGRAVSLLILQSFIQYLQKINKMEYKKRSYIQSRYKRISRVRTIKLPQHNKDSKWVKTAVATQAKYIISQDPHLTDLSPFKHNGDNTEVITPTRYLDIRCSH